MEPKSLNVGPDYAEGLISKMRTLIRKSPPQGDKLPGTAQPASFAHRLQQTLRGGFHREPPQPDSSFGGGATALVAHRSPFFFIAVALMAALALSLSLWLSGVLLVQAQDSTTIEYTENSEDAVMTLSADDPEGATPITWSLPTDGADPCGAMDPDGAGNLTETQAADNCDFKINQSGVLEFKSSPNYENPADSGTDNSYNVVVQATDGDTGANPEDTRSWFKVTVNVADVEEPGKIRLYPRNPDVNNDNNLLAATLLQPQVGVPIVSTGLMDPDGDSGIDARGTPAITTGTITYQWYRTTSMSSTGTAIGGPEGTRETYEPVHLTGGASDIGQYLRVVATYTDGRGGGKTATTVSLYPTIRAIQDNQPPSFREGDTTDRGVRETKEKGVNIGSPVRATDPEAADDEELSYWLSGGDSGDTDVQDTNDTAGDDNNVNTLFAIDAVTGQLKTKAELNREMVDFYAVTVNVTDSSGVNTNSIVVTIEVLELDEKPRITGASTIEHVEGTTVLDLDLTDNGLDSVTNNLPADGTPDGTPEPAVYVATDPEGGTVTFSLGGADKDLFKLGDLSPAEVGSKILALKEKPDFENPMDSNEDNVYEVTVQATDDANMSTKAVTVKVTNRQEPGKVVVTPAQPRIGIPVTAELTDSDVVAYGPMWKWSKGLPVGNPATCTPAAGAEQVDWENIRDARMATYTPHADDRTYCLRAVATYNDGYHQGTASTDVPIGIYPDLGDDPNGSSDRPNRLDKTANKVLSAVQYPSNNLPPAFGSAMTKRFVPENAVANNDVGEPVTAHDPNGAHTLAGYSLSGTDADSFNINAATGQLMTTMKFNHETEDMYTVMVTAEDTDGATDSIRVDIYVVDVDEAPKGTGTTMAESTEEYDENDTRSVMTLSADDPEGATPITWSLPTDGADPCGAMDPDGAGNLTETQAADNCDFKINQSGVLEFKSPPNYESPADSNTDNSYNVVVQATDGDTGATPEDTRGWFKVTVNVADVEEVGKIRLYPRDPEDDTDDDLLAATLLQPQVGVPIVSTGLMDGDGAPTGTTYEWYRTMNRSSDGTDSCSTVTASIKTGSTYTPIHESAGASDIGQYLRVVATYTDANGAGKCANTVSLYETIREIDDNTAPSFIEGDTTDRGVRETDEKGVNIGLPVRATDPEAADDEELSYWLSGGDSGDTDVQDTNDTAGDDNNVNTLFAIDAVTGQLKTKAELNREMVDFYAVTVNVTDSSGVNTDSIVVTIEVLELDEKPRITGASTIEHVEGTTVLDLDLTDNGLDSVTNNLPADGTPDGTPEPAVYVATDPEGGTVTFSLGGADKDLFKLGDLSPAEVGSKILALKEKPDFENPMDSNEDNVYEVTVQATDDANMSTKAVTVKVTNRQEPGKVVVTPAQPRIGIPVTAELTDSDVVAYGPMWQWESTSNCAMPEWMPIRDATLATYTPHADDRTYCLRAVAKYNDGFHEGTKGDGTIRYAAGDSTDLVPTGIYPDLTLDGVNIVATPDSTLYRANRLDKTANKVLSAVQYPSNNLPPAFGSAMTKRFVPENAVANNDVGEPVTAHDPNGAHTLAEYSLSGTDADSFNINAVTGQLMTTMKFNHETKEMYEVTVTATDTGGPDTGPLTDTIEVEIYVVDVDEKSRTAAVDAPATGVPSIEGPATVTYREGRTADVGTYSVRGETPNWALSGTDRRAFRISTGGVVTFVNTPDYETKTRYTFSVDAEVDGTTGTRSVTVSVTNVDEPGMLRLSPPQPVVGSVVTATLTDEDGGVTGESWRWASADTADGTYTNISEATSASYTPVDADGGKYLRATVRYRDAEGSGKSEMAVTANPVQMLAAGPYDADNSGTIDSTEVLRAVVDYFADRITPAQVLEVVRRYFADN